jgi:hypothetical protein
VVARAIDEVGQERSVKGIDSTQLHDRLVAEVNAQIAARKLVSPEGQQTRRALTLLLAAGVTPRFNRPKKTVLECVSPARLILFGDSLDDLLAGEHITHCHETFAHDVAGPKQVFRSRVGRRSTVRKGGDFAFSGGRTGLGMSSDPELSGSQMVREKGRGRVGSRRSRLRKRGSSAASLPDCA